MGVRAKTWAWVGLLIYVGLAAFIEQFSVGKYPVPTLIADLAKVAIPALFVADGLTEAGRLLSRRRNGRDDPPPTPPPTGDPVEGDNA